MKKWQIRLSAEADPGQVALAGIASTYHAMDEDVKGNGSSGWFSGDSSGMVFTVEVIATSATAALLESLSLLNRAAGAGKLPRWPLTQIEVTAAR